MAGIIKAGRNAQVGRSVRAQTFNLDDMSNRADAYLDGVRRHAAQIVSDAQSNVDSLRDQAMSEGQQAARAAAEESLRAYIDQRLSSMIPALEQAFESIQQAKQSWLKQWEEQAVHLAIEIAARVIRRELKHAPEIPVELVREALELAAGNDRVTVRLNPQDHELLNDRVEQVAQQFGTFATVTIVADSDICAGGCRVDTEFGSIDQQFEAQLARIEEELV